MRGRWRPNRTAIYLPPLFWPSALCLSRSADAQPESRGAYSAGFLYCILSPTGLVPKLHRGSRGPLLLEQWLSLPQLVSDFSGPQLADFLSLPSYIIVQSPTQSPTQSLQCHAVQRSLSSGSSVYECIMGFYLVPFRQPNPPTRFLSTTGHWNVSLPSGASLWNSMFCRVEGQYTRERERERERERDVRITETKRK